MHWKSQCRSKKQDNKILRLKLYGKIRNSRLKLEPNVLIKKRAVESIFFIYMCLANIDT